jgi:PIN domain nuclease of toxin-antitoxin system
VIDGAEELAVASITLYEIARLATNRRINTSTPLRTYLEELAAQVRTLPVTPAIAATAASLPDSFPRDPADRLIYGTAIETGWRLVTRDERLRDYDRGRITVW